MARFISPFEQYFDDGGDPLISGKLLFEVSGGGSLKTTYADAGLTIPNANPVILTAAGRQPNIFYSGQARVTLLSATDVQIEQRDPVGAEGEGQLADWSEGVIYNEADLVLGSDRRYYRSNINGNIANDPVTSPTEWAEVRFTGPWNAARTYRQRDLVVADDLRAYISLVNDNTGNEPSASPAQWRQAPGTTASAVDYQHPGTGSVATTLQATTQRFPSLDDFGADPTGASDSTAAVTACFAAVDVAYGSGTYRLDSAATVAAGKVLHLDGTLTGLGGVDNLLVVRSSSSRFAVGRNAANAGANFQSLQIGGGDPTYGAEGTSLATDGNASWLRVQPSRNESFVEANVYPTAAQGFVQTTIATNQVTRTSGTSFDSGWVGNKIYIGTDIYEVLTVPDGDNMTVSLVGGGAVSWPSTDTFVYHVGFITLEGTCDVAGTTMTRRAGDPFIPFVSEIQTATISGAPVTVSAFVDINTYTLGSPPGDATGVPYVIRADINDQISTVRVQKLIGADEENMSLFARYDGYGIFSQFAGSGSFLPIRIGSGYRSSPALANQLVVQSDGTLTIGGDFESEALRILNPGANIGGNRFEMLHAALGFSPSFRARGNDTNVGMGFDTQGTGAYIFTSQSFGIVEFQIDGAGGASHLAIVSDGFGAPTLEGRGTPADVDVRVIPKGTLGRVRFGTFTGSGDVPVVGSIEIKDQAGTVRKLAVVA